MRGSQVAIDNQFCQGWDFRGGKLSDFGQLSNQLRLDLADPAPRSTRSNDEPVTRRIVDTVTGRQVFHLPERYMSHRKGVLWDGQYLLIWSFSGEVVVVDFHHMVQTLPTALSALV